MSLPFSKFDSLYANAWKFKNHNYNSILVKGFSIIPSGGIELISDVVKRTLDIPVAVLMGANLAGEVAGNYLFFKI